MKEGNEPHRRDQHVARSAMMVFYHEFNRFASFVALSGGESSLTAKASSR